MTTNMAAVVVSVMSAVIVLGKLGVYGVYSGRLLVYIEASSKGVFIFQV